MYILYKFINKLKSKIFENLKFNKDFLKNNNPYENRLIFQPWFRDRGLKINYFDIGARGDLDDPWIFFDADSLNVFGFESDPVESKRLREKFPDRTYFPFGLWSKKETKSMYINENEYTSSLYEANYQKIQSYRSDHWKTRKTKKIVNVECESLDSILDSKIIPDFIKIDTQGSEYEIIKGASQTLKRSAPLVIAETWVEEVYKGAPLAQDVLKIMWDLGYQAIDCNIAAAWQNLTLQKDQLNCRRNLIGMDFLFCRRLDYCMELPENSFIKLLCLLDLYGFRDKAFYMLSNRRNLNHYDAEALLDSLMQSDLLQNAKLSPNLHN